MASSRPNILVFIPHDLGVHLGCYGHASVQSPRLDRLAAQGVRFANCFTPAPECTPSRGCLMTGLYPHQNGLVGLSNFGWNLRPEAPHLAARLAEAGYATHLFGFQHEVHGAPERLGYQQTHSQEKGGFHVDRVCNALAAFLQSSEAQQKPWFAYAGFKHVHRPWSDDTSFAPDEMDVPAYLPDTPAIREDLTHFHQDILDMDTAIGRALDALHTNGLDANTWVLFTTDHGAAFPGAKATLYDPGVHVSLILRRPGQGRGGRTVDDLISNLDVTPTLLEAAGIEVPATLAGQSFLPLLDGRPYTPRDQVCGALFYDVAYDPMHYVRTATHKYIRSFAVTPEDAAGADPEVLSTFAAGRWVRVDDFDVLTSPAWQALKGPSSKPPREELYDLVRDPLERTNLADEPASQAVLDELRMRMERMMQETASPLQSGHVLPPPEQREAARAYRPGGPKYAAKGL